MKAQEEAAIWVQANSLVPWDKNPRVNEHAVERIADSIRKFGWADVIVARQEDRMVISGHTRLKAAIRMGLETVPVRFLDISRQQAEHLALAANKLGELAVWNEQELADLIAEFDDPKNDAMLLGFGENEIDALLRLTSSGWEADGVADVDAIPDYDPADETFVLKVEKISASDKDRVLQMVNDVFTNAGLKYVAKAF